MSPADLQHLQLLVDHNPQIQNYLQGHSQRLATSGVGPSRLGNAAFPHALLAQAGITLPHDYAINPTTGQIEKESFISRNPWALPLIVGGAFAAPYAIPALTGGGGAAAGGAAATTGTGSGAGLLSGAAIPSTVGATSLAPTAAAATLPGLVPTVAKLGLSAAPLLMNRGGSDTNTPGNGLDPTQSAQLNELMQLLIDRAKRTAPVHQQAMDTAMRLGPRINTSPQFQQALAASTTPRPQGGPDPQVLDAIHRLMSGGGH